MFRNLALPIFLLTLLGALVMAGCGGGGDSVNSVPSGGSGGPLSEQQRGVVMDAISKKIASLSPTTLLSKETTAQEMLKSLKSRPEIVQAGVSDDQSIWGVFSDNQPFILINNESRPADASRAALPLAGLKTSTRAAELPAGKQARLFHMFGTADILTTDPRNTIAGILNDAGYTPAQEAGSLSDFRTVRDAGNGDALFYTGTHAGVGGWLVSGLPNTQRFVLWTNEIAKGPQDKEIQYRDPITVQDRLNPSPLNPRIVLLNADITSLRFVFSWPPSVVPVTQAEWHWGITAEFVKQYMNFSRNSFWYNGACSGFSAEFINACYGKGLSVYAGWDNEVNRFVSSNAGLYLFDRMAGANKAVQGAGLNLPRESPPQRSFDWGSVLNDMKQKNLATSPGPPLANLHIQANTDASQANFSQLTPSISSLLVENSKSILHISGVFGSKPGVVTINGQSVALQSPWSSSALVCTLPPPDQPGGSGDVVVEVDGHKSDPVPLTMWKITLHVVDQTAYSGTIVFVKAPDPADEIDADLGGSTTTSGDMVVYIRADVHGTRLSPGATPQPSGAREYEIVNSIIPTGNVKVVNWAGSGTETVGYHHPGESVYQHETHTLAPVGSPPVLFDGSDPRGQREFVSVNIDPQGHTMKLYVGAFAASLFEYTVVSDTTGTSKQDAGGLIFDPGNDANGPLPFTISLDSSFNVHSGSQMVTSSSSGSTVTSTFSWSGQVFNAPTDDTTRSAQIRTMQSAAPASKGGPSAPAAKTAKGVRIG